MKTKILSICLIIIFVIISCASEEKKEFVVIGIPNDIETINPLYSFSVAEATISELMFLSLIESNWDSTKGEIEYKPMLAKSWEWGNGKESLIIELRDDVFWSDSVKCTIDDVIFSFDIYSDPKIKSRAFGYFEKFYADENGYINTYKTFEKISNNKLKINFKKDSNPDLFEIDYPILPKHYFEKFQREEIATINVTESLVTNGPYKFEKWEKEQLVVLIKNDVSFLLNESSIPKFVFKVIPEYKTRITQLSNGEIDLLELIQADDIKSLKELNEIKVVPIIGREFDFIGWNNIPPKSYPKITPHKLFGSAKVRQALTYALDRDVVIDEYLNGYGQIALSPVSPLFKTITNNSLKSFMFNPKLAKKMLAQEGWLDSNNDGIIDKEGVEFAFTMHIPSGNPRREFAASLFKNNLKSVGIDMTIEINEMGVFMDNIFAKQYDAWMAGWGVPIPLNLKISWYSNFEETPLNFASYRNSKVDSLFDKLEKINSSKEKTEIYKNIQTILNDEQPYSFLYWVDNISAHNKRVKNVSISPLGPMHGCWDWSIE